VGRTCDCPTGSPFRFWPGGSNCTPFFPGPRWGWGKRFGGGTGVIQSTLAGPGSYTLEINCRWASETDTGKCADYHPRGGAPRQVPVSLVAPESRQIRGSGVPGRPISGGRTRRTRIGQKRLESDYPQKNWERRREKLSSVPFSHGAPANPDVTTWWGNVSRSQGP